MDSPEQGYPENRFAIAVDDDLKCAICLNVLREPLQCERNEHHFCAPCIKQHVGVTPECPTCLENLSLETLKKPARYLTKHLESLVILCDYESRGCEEFVKLEDLPRHLRECGYAPVHCQNDGCCEVVNKQDVFRHENELCKRRKVNCHNCVETKKEIGELKKSFEELLGKEVGELKVAFEEFKAKNEINEEAFETSSQEISELKVAFEEFKAKNQINEEASSKEISELRVAFEEFKAKKEIRDEASEAPREEIAKMKVSSVKINEDQCRQPPGENVIVVIGGRRFGFYTMIGRDRLSSSEMFVWSTKKWLPLPETNHPRSGSSAVVFENQVLVTGGKIANNTSTDSIEQIDICRRPLEWCDFPGKLPYSNSAHSCVMYQDHLIVVGGVDKEENVPFDGIYKVSLRPPYASKLLSCLPSPRAYHRAELFGDKIIVIGGISQEGVSEESVLLFDITTCKCDEIARLATGVRNLATVAWGDNVVLIGGSTNAGEAFNTVKMFNIKTRKTHMLPPMLYKRDACSAVVINNHIVVMGGFNMGTTLNVVECFDFTTYTWIELPSMKEGKFLPTSVVVPMSIPII